MLCQAKNLLENPGFGISNQILAQSLNSNKLGEDAFHLLYQIGGPRSIQLALEISFTHQIAHQNLARRRGHQCGPLE
jgi:hypothetical protein